MELQIKATPEELSKTEKLGKAFVQIMDQINPDAKEFLLKSIPTKSAQFTEPVMIEIQKKWEKSYADQMKKMINDIDGVLDIATSKKVIRQPVKAESISGWVGVDLDGTLAEYTEFKGMEHIGKPIPKMVDRVKQWLKQGKEVKIMTARANPSNNGSVASNKAIRAIQLWCVNVFGKELDVTHEKDHKMLELWDDRAVGVETNTGEVK